MDASEAVQIKISSPKKRSNFHNKFAPKFLVQELNSSFWRRPAAQGKFRYNLAGTMLGLSMHGNHLHVVLGRSAEMTPICTASHRRSNTTGPEVMVSAIKPPATDGTARTGRCFDRTQRKFLKSKELALANLFGRTCTRLQLVGQPFPVQSLNCIDRR